MDHPEPELLRAFGQGRLDERQFDLVASHVETCDQCCRRLRSLPDDDFLGQLRAADNGEPLGDQLRAADNGEPPGDQLRAADESEQAGEQSDDSASLAREPSFWRNRVPSGLRDHPRYRLLRWIGRGGMGDVFEAEHRVMGKIVALKIIRPELVEHAGAVRRFHQEVRAAARLNHANIVTAHDAQRADDAHFLVMEYVEGESLDKVVERRGPLPIVHGCHYARQAALGLEHAHERGIVHRDIKPHNLMLTPRGQIKILDFGLARLGQVAPARPSEPTLTAQGATLGTPDYVAPEQIMDASQVDYRVDLYALGCTLFFLLTGHPPFREGTAVDKLHSHLRGVPPSLGQFRPEVPAEVQQLVEQLLAKDPAKRPSSAGEVARRLAPFARPSREPERPSSAPADAALESSDSPPRTSAAGEPSQTAAQLPALTLLDGALVDERPVVEETGALNEAGASGALEDAGAADIAEQPTEAVAPSAPAGANGISEPIPRSPLPSIAAASARGPSASKPRLARQLTGRRLWAGGAVASLMLLGGFGYLASLLLAPPNPAPGPAPVVPNHSPAVLLVIPPQNVWYPDFAPLQSDLRRRGASVTVASSANGPASSLRATGQPGPEIRPDVGLGDVNGADYAAVVFVGYDVAAYRDNGEQAAAVRRLIDQTLGRAGSTVGAVCAGNAVLASHGYLEGREAARATWAEEQGARPEHARWVDRPVVADGAFLTARSDQDVREFAEALMRRLAP